MKRHVENLLGLALGALILLFLLMLAVTFFGSFLLGVLTLIASIPLAFPLSSTFVALTLIGLLVLTKIRKK
ncbi:hypothetical protein GCM10011332_28950 [Terasakiella brassicae]|uniref:Uncharacterized protein n=1 Tax=Terasakiella brassicae TaxID=1634917 RepID=A0A917C5I4_9PROT|nr:hypothetical protein [Terasakiella brassicae]GGF73151.1 hypothetical protein GCM10011332_28950 [Terasakiella brassicae]